MLNDKSIYLVLDNIRSLLNIGAIFRTADAALVKKIYLCGISAYPSNKLIYKIDGKVIDPITGDKEGNAIIKYKPSKKCTQEFLQSKIAKTALAGLNSVDWEYCIDTSDAIETLKEAGINVMALEQTKGSVDYRSANYSKPLAIVIGHERLGVSKKALALSDQIIDLPMKGKGKSLNVATATGIILYKATE